MTLGKEWVWGWLFPLGFPADWLCPQGVFSVRDRQTGGGSDLRVGGQGLLCGLGPPQPLSEPGFLPALPEITLRSLMSMQLIVAAAFWGCLGSREDVAVSVRVKTWNGKSLD